MLLDKHLTFKLFSESFDTLVQLALRLQVAKQLSAMFEELFFVAGQLILHRLHLLLLLLVHFGHILSLLLRLEQSSPQQFVNLALRQLGLAGRLYEELVQAAAGHLPVRLWVEEAVS